jgi:GNAT superfamily N-acetyltransferase
MAAAPVAPALVRALQGADRAGWSRLWAEYHAYDRSGASLGLSESVTEATWERFFHGHEPMEALVAESDGRVVGFAHLIFHRNTSVAGPVCFMQDLFVEAALHGRGIGRALPRAVYARAEAAGARRGYWHVQEANAAAVRLYDRVASRSGHVVYRKDL